MNEDINVKDLLNNSIEDFSSTITPINSTSYSVYDHWIRLATKYFQINTSQEDSVNYNNISLLKAGLFGYFNEIASHEIKNAVFHRNVLYDEHFLNSASFPESIYNFAKLYNVPISTAHPAHMLVNLVIKKDELLNSSLKEEIVSEQAININTFKTYQLTISKDIMFSINKFKYLLPYDVNILMKQLSTNDYRITASYDIDKPSNFPYYEEISSPYIKVYQDLIQGEQYVFFALDIYQMEKESKSFTINSEDISDNLFYTAEFNNQLSYFEVEYTYQGKTTILNQYFNNTYNPENSDEKYCYYTFLDDDKIQISFSSLPNSFRPRYNSSLTINVYTTLGSEANFTYNGTISFGLSTSTDSFSKINTTVVPVTDSSNGRDKLNTTGQKQRIIQEVLTRDNLITDSDLELYFTNINNNNSVNESYIKFMKKQDDFLKRIYNSFLLMREKSKKVIPTNTAKYIKLNKNDAFIHNDNSTTYVFPEHSIVVCKNNSDESKITFEYKGNYINEKDRLNINASTRNKDHYEDYDKDSIYYIIPYLIKIDTYPVLKASYYKLDIDETIDVNYSYLNSLVDASLIINKVKITKINNYEVDDNGENIHILKKEISENRTQTLCSDSYSISFELNSNLLSNELKEKIVIRGVLLSEKTGTTYGYFEFKNYHDLLKSTNINDSDIEDSSESLYEAILSTNRKFDKDGNLYLHDSVYDDNGDPITDQAIEEDLILKIGVLYKSEEGSELSYANIRNSYDKNSEFNYFASEFPKNDKEQKSINDYQLALSVTTMSSFNLYKNLSKVMSSIVTYENNNQNELKTELIPLIGAEYFLYKYDEIFSILDNYISILESVIPRLENNTTIDLKFYNSYGPSLYHHTINSDANEIKDDNKIEDYNRNNLLSRVDIIIDMKLHLYEEINDDTDEAIKKFISDFIEASNVDGVIPISNLIRLLEMNFPIIKYIEYNGLSGDYSESISNKYQKIENYDINFRNMTKQEIIEYVPEYINLKKGLEDQKIIDENGNNIPLTNKYGFIININYV